MTEKPKLIMAHKFIELLFKAGIVDDRTRRIQIDANIGDPVVLIIEKYGDDRLLKLVEDGGVVIAHSAEEAETVK